MAKKEVKPKNGDLQVWWVPQVPMKAFTVPVKSLREAKLTLDTLARYDIFQFENKVKPDFSNAGGLNVFEDGEWVDWHHPETGDDFDAYCAEHPEADADEKSSDITIRVKEKSLDNVAYIRRRNGRWHCVLSNGMHASFSYAGILRDQMGFEAQLEKTSSADQALSLVKESIGRNYSAEKV